LLNREKKRHIGRRGSKRCAALVAKGPKFAQKRHEKGLLREGRGRGPYTGSRPIDKREKNVSGNVKVKYGEKASASVIFL